MDEPKGVYLCSTERYTEGERETFRAHTTYQPIHLRVGGGEVIHAEMSGTLFVRHTCS